MLIAAGKTTEIRVRGSVESNYRTAYDVLVRPKGARLRLEREQGLVRNNYLSGLFGGISLEQWREITRIHGVEVAAPVANIGFIIPYGGRSTAITEVLNDDPVQLYRIRYTSVEQAGTSRYPLATNYVYYTQRNRFTRGSTDQEVAEVAGPSAQPVPVCSGRARDFDKPSGPFWEIEGRSCYSTRSPGVGGDPEVISIGRPVSFPILLAAIDPVEEAKLLQLDRTLVSGRYLRADDKATLEEFPRTRARRFYRRVVPVMASTKTFVDQRVEAVIERLEIPPGTDVPRRLAADLIGDAFLDSLKGTEIDRRYISARSSYENVLEGFVGTAEQASFSYWTASPTTYRQRATERLEPTVVENPLSVWRADPIPGASGAYQAQVPKANADVQFRRLHARIGSIYADMYEVPGADVLKQPRMRIVGRYDPEKLPGFSPLSEVPLETYYPPELLPADEPSRRALGGRPLLPSLNIGDYVAQPPLFLTTLEAMRPFLRPKYYAGAKEGRAISVIRVRVRGVSGPDELSQARVRAVATEIHERTGLDVDITAGSSPRKLLVELPAGKFGRPELLLEEGWSKKGVSVSFLEALDRKRLGFLSLILVTCTFFLANGAFASVRGRRTEIGTLLCLGWSPRAIFAVVLGELLLVGALAGLVAAAAAYAAAAALSLELSLGRALLPAPLALTLALVSGVVPAWRAAQAVPLDAVNPSVAVGRVRGRVRGLVFLALQNVRRMPARSLVGAGGLFIGVASLTLLLAVNQAFKGRLVGTLLGEAITVDVRGLDFLIVGLIVLLAALSLADVLYLNLRERSVELMTLRTVGWSESQLGRVIAVEALALGLLGSIPGAALGLLVGAQLGVSAAPLAAGAGIAIGGGLLVAVLASLLPLARLRTLAPATVLAEE